MQQILHPLTALKPGESAVIVRLEGHPAVNLHLCELGFAPGERVTLRRKAPLGGPLEIELLSYHLAVRPTEAESIIVCRENTP